MGLQRSRGTGTNEKPPPERGSVTRFEEVPPQGDGVKFQSGVLALLDHFRMSRSCSSV